MKKLTLLIAGSILCLQTLKAQYTNQVSYTMSNAADEKYIYYKVKSGENLTGIAKKFGTTVAIIKTLNTGIDINNIKVGQTIMIPKNPSTTVMTPTATVQKPVVVSNPAPVSTLSTNTKGTPVYHKVVSGETLYGICSKYKVTSAQVKSWNGLADINNIVVGKNLIVGYNAPVNINSNTVANPSTISYTSIASDNTITHKTDPVNQDVPSQNIIPAQNTGIADTTAIASLPKPVNPDEFSNVNAMNSGSTDYGTQMVTITEKGIANWTKSSSDDGNYYALHRTAPIGTMITVKNLNNGKSLQVKVIGKLPDVSTNQNAIIKISGSAATKLGILDEKVLVQISYTGVKADDQAQK